MNQLILPILVASFAMWLHAVLRHLSRRPIEVEVLESMLLGNTLAETVSFSGGKYLRVEEGVSIVMYKRFIVEGSGIAERFAVTRKGAVSLVLTFHNDEIVLLERDNGCMIRDPEIPAVEFNIAAGFLQRLRAIANPHYSAITESVDLHNAMKGSLVLAA